MFFGRKEDPVAVTKLVIDSFDVISEGEIARRIKRLRRQSPSSSEIDLLDALQVSKPVPEVVSVTEVAECWEEACGTAVPIEGLPALIMPT